MSGQTQSKHKHKSLTCFFFLFFFFFFRLYGVLVSSPKLALVSTRFVPHPDAV
jgi:hypothetical protein